METIARYELKYWVPEALVPAVRMYVECYLRFERAQRNTSVYFDTLDHQLYDAHVSGQPDRYKLRLRTYEGATELAFAEVKRKVREVVVKTRVPLPPGASQALLAGVPPAGVELGQFGYFLATTRAEPCSVVSCARLSFIPHDTLDSARVTFDRDIVAWRWGESPRDARPIDGESEHGRAGRQVMLELKFAEPAAPQWMSELVERFELRRAPYSKFCAAMRVEADVGRHLVDRLPLARAEREVSALELATFGY